MADRGITAGVLDGDSLAVLTQSPGSAPNSHELGTIGYGPRRDELADDLAGQVRGWDAAGRPGTQGLRIDAYPAAVPEDELPDRPRIRKRHNWFVLSAPPTRADRSAALGQLDR